MKTVMILALLGQFRYSGGVGEPSVPTPPTPPIKIEAAGPPRIADWPSRTPPRSFRTAWPVRVVPASLRAPEAPRRSTYDLPDDVFAPEQDRPAVRTVALQQPAPDPHAAAEPSSMPVPAGIRKPVMHDVLCVCCGSDCACTTPGQCGHAGCACGHSLKNVPLRAAPPAAGCCPTCGRCHNAPTPTSAAAPPLAPKQWIVLTNEPGVRGYGRLENGWAVDIERREPIPGYIALATVSYPPQVPVATQSVSPAYFIQSYGGYGAPLQGGGCVGGACGTQSRGGLFGGLFR